MTIAINPQRLGILSGESQAVGAQPQVGPVPDEQLAAIDSAYVCFKSLNVIILDKSSINFVH